ncbi:MAG: glycosyltransferase family 4 protein [Butyrivibrio sp.]|nr:glycosyltransferase family 4 protein [Butyrivibrio sp.]
MSRLATKNMRIVIFGTGQYFENRQFNILDTDEIVCFIDNNANNKRVFYGKKVYLPEDINSFDYDVVLIMASDRDSMINQLLQLSVLKTKIWTYEDYIRHSKNNYKYLDTRGIDSDCKVLIITDGLKYDGGAISSINAAMALVQKGYGVTIAAATLEEKIESEILNKGISIIASSRLPYVGKEELSIFKSYDHIIVNTFPMLPSAYILSSYLNVVWWIHEPSDCEMYSFYKDTRRRYWQYDDIGHIKNNGVRIVSVSNVAKKAFESIYPNSIDGLLPMAIVDEKESKVVDDDRISFAIIGVLNRPKGHIELLEAFLTLQDAGYKNTRCEIIGKRLDESFCKEVDKYIDQSENIEYLGILNRTQLRQEFRVIDVVVCASYEETLSLTIVEGMMNSKICITTDNTGIAEYIEDGVNGFICKAGNADSLAEKMKYIIDHFNELDEVRKNARKTYEKFFTLDILGENLERELKLAEMDRR